MIDLELLPSLEERQIMTDDLLKSKMFRESPDLVKIKLVEYPPYNTYRLKTTDQIVFIRSLIEDENGQVTFCTVNILAMLNPGQIGNRSVFNIQLKHLENLGICNGRI